MNDDAIARLRSAGPQAMGGCGLHTWTPFVHPGRGSARVSLARLQEHVPLSSLISAGQVVQFTGLLKMSFGIGIGDILLVAQLAKTTVANCRSAPNDFAEASRVSQSLYLMLDGVRIEYANTDSPLHRDERTRTDFAIHFKNCEHSMKPMAAYVDKFASLSGPNIRLLDRFRISKRQLMELRGNLAFYTTRMSDFLQVIGLATVGRVEKKVDDVRDYLPQLMAKLDQMCAEVRIMGEKESLLSEHPDDEKLVWKEFRTRLLSAGFTSSVLREHEASLFLRIRELTQCGLLDSDISSKLSPEPASPEDSPPVFQFPWPDHQSVKADSDDYCSDAESETTITSKASMSNLKSKRIAASIKQNSEEQKQELDEPKSVDGSRLILRVWRDRVGNAIAKATMLEEKGGYIILQDKDNQEIQVSRNSLSDLDIDFLRSWHNQSNSSTGEPNLDTREQEIDPTVKSIYDDAVSVVSDADIIDLPRSTRPKVLVGKKTFPVVLVGRRTHVEPRWRYRVQSSLPAAPVAGRFSRALTNDSLPSAAGRGDLETVKWLLKTGYNIESVGPKSYTVEHGGDPPTSTRHSFPETTALYRAADAGYFDVALYLVERGANVNTRNGYDGAVGEPILCEVVRNGNEKIIRLLLEYEAKIWSALYVACECYNRGIVRLLLDYDANIDWGKATGYTPLYNAASHGEEYIVELLLQEGATYDTVTLDGESPLYAAASSGYTPIVKLLLEAGAATDTLLDSGETPLYAAASSGYAKIVKLLLREGAAYDTMIDDGQSPLYKAAGRGHLKVVEYLLRYGSDSSIGRGRHGETTMYKVAWNNDVEILELLLRYEADCNLPNETTMVSYKGVGEQVLHGIAAGIGKAHSLMNHWSRTALHAAACQGHEEIVTMLIDHGAQLDIAGNDGQTALYLAAHEHHRGVVQLLLKSGAQIQTEKHDPVLALLGKKETESSTSRSLTRRFNDPQSLAKIGTTDALVGFVAKLTENFSKRRR